MTADIWLTQLQENGYRLTGARRAVVEAIQKSTQDRKSTRLNSSRLGISYAVFCLKKKKRNGASDGHIADNSAAPAGGHDPTLPHPIRRTEPAGHTITAGEQQAVRGATL